MRSAFSGLDIAYRALQAQQQAIDVVNHNIANANTPGYSRQTAILATTPPYTIPTISRNTSAGQMGTGVAVIDVQRTRYSLFDYQIRGESQTLGKWEKTRDALSQVEVIFNEPSGSGLNSLLSKFWQAWQDLTNAPQDAGARSALAEQADSLAVAFNRNYIQLTNIQQDLDSQIRVGADQINDFADRIASLNVQIAQVELVGQRANDLRDQRDLLLDQLSSLVKVSYSETPEGAVNVFLGSRVLVTRGTTERVTTTTDANGFASIIWQDDGSAASVTDGQLYGLQQARDLEIPQFVNDLQSLSGQLITQVNTLHRTGFGLDNSTGLDFFNGSGANDMAVNPVLKTNPERIATAAAADSPGDNSVGLAIAGLQRALTMNGGTSDFGKFFAAMVSRLGVGSQRAEMMASNQKLLVDHLTRQRDSLSGVSLDQETTLLIEHQRAYEAAARVINTVDELLDKLINGTGLVGR